MATAGPFFGSSASGTNWSNTGNLYASDSTYCTYAKGSGGVGADTLSVTGFGFNIPSTATITGITATIIHKASGGATVTDYSIRILKNGTAAGNDKANASSWSTNNETFTYGSSSDLWGTTWTYSDINASNFGVSIRLQFSSSGTGYVDSVRLTVNYTTLSGPNNPSAASGWTSSTNVYTSNDTRATRAVSSQAVDTQWLTVTGFGFNIDSSATIDGILVEIEKRDSNGSIQDYETFLTKDGSTNTGSNRANTGVAWPTSDAYSSNGGLADLWGTTWTYSEINSSNFGVRLRVYNPSTSSRTAAIDHIRITIGYTLPTYPIKMYYQRLQQSLS